MKIIAILTLLFTTSILFAQNEKKSEKKKVDVTNGQEKPMVPAEKMATSTEIKVKVSGNIFNLDTDTLKVSQFFGSFYKDFATGLIDKKGNFSIETKLPAKDYYVLRIGNTHINLILENGSDVKVYGDGKNIAKYCNIVGSDATSNMNAFIRDMEVWNNIRDSATRIIQQNPNLQQEVNQALTQDYYKFDNIRQTFLANNLNSPALLPALSTYDPQREWEVYEGIVKQLQNGFGGSPTITQVSQIYEQEKIKIEAGQALAPGKLAPDFQETKLDGTTMKLSDLKGKVVLIDFWASWCGPCRKENPTVVRLYNQYKDKGFTVMSVSLDSDKARWEAAILQDNLTWPNHVSDLNKWNSKVARLYNVSSIPFTVLIDQEGNVVKTNLRGEALEAELVRIFGN